jgi:hypothetical protein
MRKLLIWLAGSAVICLALTGCDLKEKYERSVEMPLSISAGQKLVVCTDVGSIKVVGSNVQQTGIKAKITGRADTVERAQVIAEAIKIIVENNNDIIVIKIDKPTTIKSNWYAVDYIIDVPEDISLEYKTDVGSATVSNIKGDIAVSCDVGSITCENVRGKMNLSANVGNIKLAYAEDANNQVNADLSVDVGSIHFKGPKNISAKFNASTDVGSIHSDLPITVQGKICKRSLNGTVGQGQGDVRLKADVGSIHIE